MSWMGVKVEVVVAGIEEERLEGEEPEEMVVRLATKKAEGVAEKLQATSYKLQEGVLVIGADTVIVVDGEVIGKPEDKKQAREIIKRLQGREHEVITGVCVVDGESGERRAEVEKTRVAFERMSEVEIKWYLDAGEWQGKAGGYQILGAIAPYVKEIDSSVSNVIGLPLGLLQEMLNEMGMDVEVDLRQVIEKETGYGR